MQCLLLGLGYFIFHIWYIKYYIINHIDIPTDETHRSDILTNKNTFVAINIFFPYIIY